ncbi:hypothetical protein PIROE2DRAFT_64471 [Piromyces sp. E2]|nr:hypothetical protein PIROE2DRAFT_64471 [Piromyces sp. E2]|eukprot:OUM58351.1 hypothetical protein PIROE2DRAFT_64471 [Piromyces sp. E2]
MPIRSEPEEYNNCNMQNNQNKNIPKYEKANKKPARNNLKNKKSKKQLYRRKNTKNQDINKNNLNNENSNSSEVNKPNSKIPISKIVNSNNANLISLKNKCSNNNNNNNNIDIDIDNLSISTSKENLLNNGNLYNEIPQSEKEISKEVNNEISPNQILNEEKLQTENLNSNINNNNISNENFENRINSQITEANSNVVTRKESNAENNCENLNSSNDTKIKNLGPISVHIYNIFKECLFNYRNSLRYCHYSGFSISNLLEVYNIYFHKYVNLANNQKSINNIPIGAGKRFLAINDTTEPTPGVIQLENTYNKKRYKEEWIKIRDGFSEDIDLITLSNDMFHNFKIKEIKLIMDIIKQLNGYCSCNNVDFYFYSYTDSQLKEFEYKIMNDLKNLFRKLYYYCEDYYFIKDFIDKIDCFKERLKSNNISIDNTILNYLNEIETIEYITTLFKNKDKQNGLEAGDSKVLLKLFLYAQTLVPVADDPSDFCVNNAHIIPDKDDYMVVDPNINNKEPTLYPSPHASNNIQSIEAVVCDIITFFKVAQNEIKCIVGFEYQNWNKSVAVIPISLNSLYNNINSYDVGWWTINNSLINGKSVNILPSLKDILPLSLSTLIQTYNSINKLIDYWNQHNGSKRAYDEAFLIASDIFNVYPIGSFWHKDQYINRWWFPSKSNKKVDESGTLKETCNSFPLHWNRFTTASGRRSGSNLSYYITPTNFVQTISIYANLYKFESRVQDYIRCNECLIYQSRLNKIMALTMDRYAQLLSIPYWGYYIDFQDGHPINNQIFESIQHSLQKFSEIISILYPNTSFKQIGNSYYINHFKDFDILKNIPVDILYSTPMARIDSEWATFLGMNKIPQSSSDILEIINDLEYEKHGKSIYSSYSIPNINDIEKLIEKSYSDKIVTAFRRGGFYKNWNDRDDISNLSIRIHANISYKEYNDFYIDSLTFTVNNPFLYEGRKLQNERNNNSNETAVYTRTSIPLRHIANYKSNIDIRDLFVPVLNKRKRSKKQLYKKRNSRNQEIENKNINIENSNSSEINQSEYTIPIPKNNKNNNGNIKNIKKRISTEEDLKNDNVFVTNSNKENSNNISSNNGNSNEKNLDNKVSCNENSQAEIGISNNVSLNGEISSKAVITELEKLQIGNLNNKSLQKNEFPNTEIINNDINTNNISDTPINNSNIKENSNEKIKDEKKNIDENSNKHNDTENNDTEKIDTEIKNLGPISRHIYNILKEGISCDNENFSCSGNIIKDYKNNFHKSVNLVNDGVVIHDIPIGAGKRFLAVNDTTEPTPGIIQLENTYDKKRYNEESIEIRDSSDLSFLSKDIDQIINTNKINFFKIKQLNLIYDIINKINNNNNNNGSSNNYYFNDFLIYSPSELFQLKNEMMDELNYLIQRKCHSRYYYNTIIGFINDTEIIKELKSYNINIDDKIIKDIKTTEFFINLFINVENQNGIEAGDSKVLLKLFLYAQTFAPIADDPSDFCVDNAHIIPIVDNHDSIVFDPNVNIKEPTLFPSRYNGNNNIQSIEAVACDIETFFKVAQKEIKCIPGFEYQYWDNSVAVVPISLNNEMSSDDIAWWTILHLQYPFCTMFHKATIYQGKEPCQLAPETVGAYTTPSNITYIGGPTSKVLYVLIDDDEYYYKHLMIGGYNNVIEINFHDNSLINGKSVDILPSLKDVISHSSSNYYIFDKLLKFWCVYNGSKRAYDEAFLIASDIFNVYPIGSFWHRNEYINRWWFPSKSNIEIDESGTLKETCNNFPHHWNQFTTASEIVSMFYPNTTFEYNSQIGSTYYIRKDPNFDISKTIPIDVLCTTPMARIDSEWAILLRMNEIPQSTNDIMEIIQDFEYEKHNEGSIRISYSIPTINCVEKLIQKSYSDKIVTVFRRGGFIKNWNNRDDTSNLTIKYCDSLNITDKYLLLVNFLSYVVNNPFLYEGRKLLNKYNYNCCGSSAVYTLSSIPVRYLLDYEAEINLYGIRSILVPGNWYNGGKKSNFFHGMIKLKRFN